LAGDDVLAARLPLGVRPEAPRFGTRPSKEFIKALADRGKDAFGIRRNTYIQGSKTP
jgi:hypothetical protein